MVSVAAADATTTDNLETRDRMAKDGEEVENGGGVDVGFKSENLSQTQFTIN